MSKNLSLRLRALVEQFISKNPNFKPSTRQNYRCSILKSLSYLEKSSWKGGLPINIKRGSLIRWLRKMKKRYVPSYTVMPRVRRVSRFFQFLIEKGYMEENPFEKLRERYPGKGLKGVIFALMGSSPRKTLKGLKLPPRFSSPLGSSMQEFITLGRSQGKAYLSEERILCSFDRFLSSQADSPEKLSDSILKQWLHLFSTKSRAHQYKNFNVVRRFCLYLSRFNPRAYRPDLTLPSLPQDSPIPHIYSGDELIRLLKAFRQSKPSPQFSLLPHMLSLLTLLLYTTGMRLGEALNLRLKDIDWRERKIYIYETKFHKSRLVPLSWSMTKELKRYLQFREKANLPGSPESFLFQNLHRRRPYTKSTIERFFRHTLRELGLKPKQGCRGPRIHDLRHTFAVHRLERWYEEGKDVQTRLGLLSTYLGHVGIASTQRYLTMTPELLQQASQRFNHHFTSIPTKKGESK